MTENGRNAKSKWSAYGWQCDMIGIPAVRHSDTGQESPLGTIIYRFNKFYKLMYYKDSVWYILYYTISKLIANSDMNTGYVKYSHKKTKMNQ